jgi:hypothetical protein
VKVIVERLRESNIKNWIGKGESQIIDQNMWRESKSINRFIPCSGLSAAVL